MKIRGVMARRGDTPGYVRQMQEELFDLVSAAGNRQKLGVLSEKAAEIYRSYRAGLENADPAALSIRRRVSRTSYSRRCAEASAVRSYQSHGIRLAPGMQISYVVEDAKTWQVAPSNSASRFDSGYYEKLLEKAWEEVRFVFNSKKR
jgi:DNA polymerase elongation subunit (family B)